MLSSMWRSVSVYECHGNGHVIYIVASSKVNARKAFINAMNLEPTDCRVIIPEETLLITEEAQVQSELFPNQVRK